MIIDMSPRARITAVFTAGALVGICVVGACADHHCSDANGCTLSDEDLQSCANVDTGIYGVMTSCESRTGCDPSAPGHCGGTIVVVPPGGAINPGVQQVFEDAGTSVASATGRYALALSPGDYSVCCGGDGPLREQSCTVAHVQPGKLVRVDARLDVSAGGATCTTH